MESTTLVFLPFVARALSAECAAWEYALAMAVILVAAFVGGVLVPWVVPGGAAWGRTSKPMTIPGPRGWPLLGSLLDMGGLAHRRLAKLAQEYGAKELMALSLGSTRLIVTSQPEVARELLNSAAFADRPLKQSAEQLLFARAIGFAPYGDYWRNLRRIASNHLFSPRQIAAQEHDRQLETARMVDAIARHAAAAKSVQVREFLQRASLHNIIKAVFGKRYEDGSPDAAALRAMVAEGFELLGAFNWGDHLPQLRTLDPHNILNRCSKLSQAVSKFVKTIIEEKRSHNAQHSAGDFVGVLLSLQGEEKLEDADIVAVLWEMIFRGTDTVALVVEWTLAEIILHPEIQERLHSELDQVVGANRRVDESDVSKLKFLQAVVKESLRMHPPGPLLSWARLAVHDVSLGGHHVPAGTTAMVNMWSITHDPAIWSEPETFNPDRFLEHEVDIKGTDLRLAPFGAGRRVCPGRALGLATVHLWIANLLHEFEWEADGLHPVDLTEVLKLSSEMASPLRATPNSRRCLQPL